MSGFFTNEEVSLSKEIDNSQKFHQTSVENIKTVYEIERCVEWIKTNHFQRVCLQFPDHLLCDSVEVSFELQEALDRPVYIMGDTSYESCCIDFIAAAHVNADAIIHYGSVCFSQPTNTLPFLNIYEKYDIDIGELKTNLHTFCNLNKMVLYVLVDTPYLHQIDEINDVESTLKNIKIVRMDNEVDYSKEGLYIYIGNNDRKLENIQYSLNEQRLFQYDPSSTNSSILSFKENPVIRKRRYYLAEKIKDSKTFGIVMGTLAVDNFLRVLARIKKLMKLNRKKYYVISVGKISVAKLANFPEVEVFVVISCALNEVYDSREFYKPIVTPYDIENVFNPKLEAFKFTYDYNRFLDNVTSVDNLKPIEPDVSLLTGYLTSNQIDDERNTETGGEIILKNNGTLVETSTYGAGYLAGRNWKGLDQNLGKTEVKLAKEGRTGIAQCYSNEIGEKNK